MPNICAIATAYGVGAISIIRVSGPDAISLVSKIFKGKDLNKVDSHTINYGSIFYNDEVIDEVMVSVMRAPRTFTKEDSVEINCHGGLFVTNKVLETLLIIGCRLARPGEFTERAFLNGRIDLTQAEAIIDVINAENNRALKVSNLALRKETTKLINAMRAKLVDVMAQIEVHIDYPEYDDAIEMTNSLILPFLQEVICEMKNILERSRVGKTLVHGIKTAIIGRPNVGKSSLLNLLLSENKAIVSNIAGTTRDIVEGSLNIGNVTLKLIDTAGIRNSEDVIEQIGVNKSYEVLESCDLVLMVLDASKITEEDLKLLDETSKYPRVVIVNKKDLNAFVSFDFEYVLMSVKDEHGLEELETAIIKQTNLDILSKEDGNYLTNARQIGLLSNAIASLESALSASNSDLPIDLVEMDVHNAYELLGEIIGVVNKDSLLDELFSKFCLGK